MRIEENVLSLERICGEFWKLLFQYNQIRNGVPIHQYCKVKRLPAILGGSGCDFEMLTMPRSKYGREASVWISNVRGGGCRIRILILYNQSTIFKSSHVFGSFSALIQTWFTGVELYKGFCPGLNYGGRPFLCLQITPKSGAMRKLET